MKQLQKLLLNVLTICIRQKISLICKRLYKSRKKCCYFYYMLNKHEVFDVFRLCVQRFMEKLCVTPPTVTAFMIRHIIALKGIFSILALAGFIKVILYLQVYHWLSKQVFYSTEIVFFVLIPRYGCFRHEWVKV